MSEQDKLFSAVGVDYAQLRDLLAAGQWQKADEQTGALMLKIGRRVRAGWLREEDIKEFPCEDLLSIDRLWVKYSNDRFGFSVQSHIWESVGEDYGKFSNAVGWRLYNDLRQWRKYSDLIFSQSAPLGHLPAAPFFGPGGLHVGWAATLAPKLVDCCES